MYDQDRVVRLRDVLPNGLIMTAIPFCTGCDYGIPAAGYCSSFANTRTGLMHFPEWLSEIASLIFSNG